MSNATLNRFYALHYLLPFVLAALAMVHMMTLHTHGSGNPSGVQSNSDKVPMHPYYLFKDLVTLFLFLAVVAYVVCFVPNLMGHSDNYLPANPMVTPPSIVPEWYLLPYYAILRAVPNKLLGVVAMLASLLILLAMPLLDTSRVRGGQFRPLWRGAFWLLVADLALLGFIGASHAEEPWVTIGAGATILYFAWYLVIVPAVGVIENTLADLDADRTLF